MQQQPSDFKALQVLFISLVTGMVAFILIAVYIVYSQGISRVFEGATADQIFWALLGFAALCLLTGFALYKRKINKLVQDEMDPKNRLVGYRAAAITRWAMIELPVMVSVLFYMMTYDYRFLLTAILLFLVFIWFRPQRSIIAKELAISKESINAD